MNTAVVGCGFMGSNHARVLSEISNLVAVCDVDGKKAEALAEKYGCRAYTDYVDMVNSEEIKALSVIVPTFYHHKVGKDLLGYGFPVLIEKPLASNAVQAKELVDISQENNTLLMVGHIERFNPVVSTAKSIIDQGLIGEVKSLRGVRVGPFTPRVKDAGVLHILAIHDLDIFSYLSNSPIKSVECMAVQKCFSEFEDIASVLCDTVSGVVCSLEVNWTSPRKIRSLTVTGTKGILELDYLTQSLVLTQADGARDVKNYSDYLLYHVVGEQRLISVKPEEPLKVELQHFLDCVRKNVKPLVTGQDGLDALKTVEECKRCIV